MEKCTVCKKNFDSPVKLYAHLVEKHEMAPEEARLVAWPKGAAL